MNSVTETNVRPQTETNGNRLYFSPRVDVLETGDALVFLADVPGAKPDQADVQFHNGELVIHCRCDQAEPRDYAQHAFDTGDYYRAFTINENVDPDHISAELKNGVLTVRVPKAEEAKPRKITVKSE